MNHPPSPNTVEANKQAVLHQALMYWLLMISCLQTKDDSSEQLHLGSLNPDFYVVLSWTTTHAACQLHDHNVHLLQPQKGHSINEKSL